jgi:hypothetical protein
MVTVWSAVAAIAAIVLWGLKQWQASKPQRNQEDRDAEIQKGRADIANGDAAAVSVRIDSVPASGTDTTSDSAGVSDDADTARRLAKITGQ